jgi:hypothetical protein
METKKIRGPHRFWAATKTPPVVERLSTNKDDWKHENKLVRNLRPDSNT